MMTVVKWEQNGMPVAHKGGRGRPSLYDPAAVAAWVAARETNAADSSSLEEARIRKELSQAALNEQRLAVMEGKLLPAEEVEKAWAREVAAVRTAIMATYATVARVRKGYAPPPKLPSPSSPTRKSSSPAARSPARTGGRTSRPTSAASWTPSTSLASRSSPS
jgi:hypothetical protein